MDYRMQRRMDHKRKSVSPRKFRTTTDMTLGIGDRRNRNLGSLLLKIRLSKRLRNLGSYNIPLEGVRINGVHNIIFDSYLCYH